MVLGWELELGVSLGLGLGVVLELGLGLGLVLGKGPGSGLELGFNSLLYYNLRFFFVRLFVLFCFFVLA